MKTQMWMNPNCPQFGQCVSYGYFVYPCNQYDYCRPMPCCFFQCGDQNKALMDRIEALEKKVAEYHPTEEGENENQEEVLPKYKITGVLEYPVLPAAGGTVLPKHPLALVNESGAIVSLDFKYYGTCTVGLGSPEESDRITVDARSGAITCQPNINDLVRIVVTAVCVYDGKEYTKRISLTQNMPHIDDHLSIDGPDDDYGTVVPGTLA